MKLTRSHIVGAVLVAVLTAVTVVAMWRTEHGRSVAGSPAVAEPVGIMGTATRLIAVMPPERSSQQQAAVQAGEAELRRIESLMSWRIDASDVGRLNAAKAGQVVQLSRETCEVLFAAKRAYDETRGAFDVTCWPLIRLWADAGKAGRVPSLVDRLSARRDSRWVDLSLVDGGAKKLSEVVRVDLGGIAKGYGVDCAMAAMQRAGATAGLVTIGGDMRCFGLSPDGDGWLIGIRDPFGAGTLGTLKLNDRAVSTSGNYERFVMLEGRRYSHIVDPREGGELSALLAGATPSSATVIAPSSTTADAWSTALSVLGSAGLRLLPRDSGIEAMLIIGGPEDYKIVATPGFAAYLKDRPARYPQPGGEGGR